MRYVLEAPKPFIVGLAHGDSGSRRHYGIEEPLTTVHAGGKNNAVVVPSLATLNHGGGREHAPKALDEPFRTLTASRDAHALIAPVITAAQHGGSVRAADDPMHTIAASRKDQNAVIVPTIVGCGGRAGQSAPRAGDDPLGTLTAKADGCVVAATMVQTGYGEREGQAPRCLDIDAPIGTQVGGSRRIGGVNPGREATEPLATLTAAGAQQAVVAPSMMRQFGTSVGHGLNMPTHTDTATVNKSALISAFLTKYYGEALPNQAVDEPVHTVTTKPRHGLVTVEIDGATYAIADIGMRMLTPRERFRAQGFPDSYIIDRRPDGSPISTTIQGSCCGNSVCPPLAEALVSANCGHLAAAPILEAAE